MNHDIAEVNPQTLPGSFLYKKERGYQAKWYTTSNAYSSVHAVDNKPLSSFNLENMFSNCNKMVNWHAIYPVIQLH